MSLLKPLSAIRYRRFFYLFLFFLPVFPGASASPEHTQSGIRLPFLKQRNDSPIFSIYVNPGMPAKTADYPRALQPGIILAVWKDGSCVWSEDKLYGGPPYNQGNLSEESRLDLEKELGSFKTPETTACYVCDADWMTIALHDENTSRCVEMVSSHEYFPYLMDSRDKGYTQFFETWGKLRRCAYNLNCRPTPSQEELQFDLRPCPPHKPLTALLFRYVGADRRLVHPVIVESCDTGYPTVLQDIPVDLIVSCKRGTTKQSFISALRTAVTRNSVPKSTGRTTEMTFYWPDGKERFVLDLDQMLELKKYWNELSSLPPSVSQYFEEIGLLDNR
ncbi:MAG TPA: hypothetical protein PKH31_07795 [Candidatus Sumerlaeota bacterium]|nr:hypothetical protein [Candidatus Sumerlaeota bacterium]